MDESLILPPAFEGVRDELTGLYNRRGFYKYTEVLIEQYPQTSFCLAYWNIRRFKIVNNLFGWQAGDNILIQLANAMKGALSDENATLGRVERDNFICCVPIEIISQEKWTKMTDLSYFVGEVEYHFSCCYGLYQINEKSMSVSEMEDKARIAMETIKDNYMCSCAWFQDSMWNTILEEQKLSNDFRSAISNKQFKIYYQPVCRAQDGTVEAAEALVRWEHPTRGLIPPGIFVPMFEDNGFISILDRYVWNEVCRMLKDRLDKGLKVVPVSINVSRVEFYKTNLCEEIRDIVASYDVPANLIKIEITETAYAENPKQMQEAVSKFHEYGFVVLMDDFGSGYSSLSTLKDVPIDILKVDMKFLHGFETSHKSAIILEAVIRMAKWMNLKVVAEGVEAKKEWDYLKSVECDMLQGYYFYRPMPLEAFGELLDWMEGGKGASYQKKDKKYENVAPDEFRLGNFQADTLFYGMLGGMGVFELTDSELEIIQVNKGFYEVIYNTTKELDDEAKVLNKKIEEPDMFVLVEKCRRAMESRQMQQVQIHYRRRDNVYIWLKMKIRYIGSQGKRSLFYFAVDNIDEEKKREEEGYFLNYSTAIMRFFDKVYRLDYETGMGEVLHTKGADNMQLRERVYFKDFFTRFAADIEWIDGGLTGSIIENKALLDRELEKSVSGSLNICYKATGMAEGKRVAEIVSALLFRVKMPDEKEEYLCCIKKIAEHDIAE